MEPGITPSGLLTQDTDWAPVLTRDGMLPT